MQKDELPSLEELERKISKSRKVEEPLQDVTNKGAGFAIRLSSELIAGVLVGLIIGYYLDKWFSTSPLFLIVCFLCGFVAGFRAMIRTVMAMEELESSAGSDKKTLK